MLNCVRRSEISPMVCFQRYARLIVSPSTQQPPGKRTNDGFSPTSISARSGRKPFWRLFQVFCGNNETTSSQNVPGLVVLMTRRLVGSVSETVNETEYDFQSELISGIVCLP